MTDQKLTAEEIAAAERQQAEADELAAINNDFFRTTEDEWESRLDITD